MTQVCHRSMRLFVTLELCCGLLQTRLCADENSMPPVQATQVSEPDEEEVEESFLEEPDRLGENGSPTN